MPDRYHTITSRDPGIRWAVEEVYDRSFFWARERPYWKRDNGSPRVEASRWALDTRVGLAHADLLAPIADALSIILRERGITQIAGYGYGSFLLMGALLRSASGLTAGMIRESRKQYGFRNRVEGALTNDVPTVIVDDIVSSGRSALRAAADLRVEGFKPVGVLAVYVYAGRRAELRLGARDLTLDALATTT